MPSSTPWRRHSSSSVPRDSSPSRPTSEHVEPLSPGPFDSLTTATHTTWRPESKDGTNYNVTGLGLTDTLPPDQSARIVQAAHLYIDQNGGAHVGSRGRPSGHRAQKHARDGGLVEGRSNTRHMKAGKTKGHTRSGSTIDDLANAAIATSPRFAAASPSYAFSSSPSALNSSRPATSYVNGYYHNDSSNERPAKRIRSDKLHSIEWSSRDQRPRTSHANDYQSPRTEEAELLLGLRYSLDTQASPSLAIASLRPESVKENIQPPSDVTTNTDDEPEVKQEPHKAEGLIPSRLYTTSNGVARQDATPASREADKETDPLDDNMEVDASIAQLKEPQSLVGNLDVELDRSGPDQVALGTNTQLVENFPNSTAKSTTAPKHSVPLKKPKKIQPEVQAELCASCLKLQRDGRDEDSTTQWIGCEHCNKWFHTACAGFKDKAEARSVDKFFCKNCEVAHGKTTFVRKSSRARTAIDYAGLNQGLIKPSGESTMHHYIQPIKDGRIKYLSDDFARVRPELMTAQFWESMDGMKRPFVVPACWNPRFGVHDSLQDAKVDTICGIPIATETDQYFDAEGKELQANEIGETSQKTEELNLVEVMDCDQDYLDMVMPRDLTVRKVAELFGPEQPVPVIDVKSQETKGQFTLANWADYYEQPGEKPIRNVISLEVSNSRLGRLIRRPQVVRDIDLEDCVWDSDSRGTSNKRPVQFYCLMSVADSYTDFHIDFGGSSVYYHILKGVKTFFFIPPEDKYLKKYEEWCNSDTQNDTWLGDLCNGNVTRVDLHEGDTAFIPAGWIHSVWTPEDSLVVGGNFLTRLDYELQLKVANVEKTTRVPQKFRYPFFQKVMWYALLKYLEEDPVPEEVLRDFHENEDYHFDRANPIWSGLDDLADSAEPGEPWYNARVYPKSELKGLPALRDYLYRTARIHADLPVPDINKKQIDAVKASIPKGHGDPMQLIKTFAVWCAWKIGNESVPEWAHTDLNGLLPEIRERERTRKAETFRVPPERVSARKTQVQSAPLEEASPSERILPSTDSEESTSKPQGSKSGGLRVACDACRKRRIKCRHKEGDASPSSASPAAIRPRTYSNVSVEIPKLASASPILSEYEQTPVLNGASVDFSNTDLAQAALATLHSQSSDPSPMVSNATHIGSAKKGRSKACEECRKSKRRCVHDEYGRVDPAKAAEPSKPRGTASSKRAARLSDEGFVRRMNLEPEIDPALLTMTHSVVSDAMIDPALMAEGINGNMFQPSSPSYLPQFEDMDIDKIDPALTKGPFVEAVADITMHDSPDNATDTVGKVDSVVRDPESAIPKPIPTPSSAVSTHIASLRQSPVHDISYSPITVDGNPPEVVEKTGMASVKSVSPVAIPKTSLRASDQIAQLLDQTSRSSAKVSVTKADSKRRESSDLSEHTMDSPAKSRRSSSNTTGVTHQAGTAMIKAQLSGRPMSRDSTADSDADADEKLARELQAAENGLRRRTSVRA